METSTVDTSNTIAVFALLISVAAFAVSILALMWSLIRHFMLDRVHLRLIVQAGLTNTTEGEALFLEAGNPQNASLTIPAIRFTILNDGRRKVFINTTGIEYGGNHSLAEVFPVWKRSPKSLVHFVEPHDFWLEPYEAKTSIITGAQVSDLRIADLRCFFVEDARQKHWRTTRRVRRRFRDTFGLI